MELFNIPTKNDNLMLKSQLSSLLKGRQFWPNQHKSHNKINKFISKSFKSLKHKLTRKNRKGKNATAAEEVLISKIIYRSFSTETSIIKVRSHGIIAHQ